MKCVKNTPCYCDQLSFPAKYRMSLEIAVVFFLNMYIIGNKGPFRSKFSHKPKYIKSTLSNSYWYCFN